MLKKCWNFYRNIFVQLFFFQQTVGILMGTNCALLLADLFLHSYEVDFIADFIQKKKHALISVSAV